MTTETTTPYIPTELLSLVATAENPTVQVWLEDGDIYFRIWLQGPKHVGLIGGMIDGRFNTFYATVDDDVRHVLCFIKPGHLEVRYKPSDSYEPRKEGDE